MNASKSAVVPMVVAEVTCGVMNDGSVRFIVGLVDAQGNCIHACLPDTNAMWLAAQICSGQYRAMDREGSEQ